MSLRILPDLVQGSDEWMAARRGMVTASVVGQLLSVRPPGADAYGCSECLAEPGEPCVSQRSGSTGAPIKTMHSARTRYAAEMAATAPSIIAPATGDTARSLTALLAAERITGWTDPTFMSADMWMGMESEPLARQVYADNYAPVETVGLMVRDDWGFDIGYSPDGLVGDEGLIEVKSRRQKNHLTTILAGDVPAENMAQIQCGLLVSRRAWCDYVGFCGGMKLWRKRVEPDERWFAAIIAAVRLFESNAAEMIAAYDTATEGFPMTERAEMEMVI